MRRSLLGWGVSGHGAAVCLKGRMGISFFSCLIDSRVLIDLHVSTVAVCVDKKLC